MATRRKPRRVDRFNQGVELSLGITTSLQRRLREIDQTNTVEQAWASVGDSLRWAMQEDPPTWTTQSK